MSSRLNTAGNDWVKTQVQLGFAASELANAALFRETGIPPMPNKDTVIQQAQAQLAGRQAAVEFMMNAEKEGRPPFTYQTKLVFPGSRIHLLEVLLNRQGNTMGTPDYPQKSVFIDPFTRRHLVEKYSQVRRPTWYWEFGQGCQILQKPQKEDEVTVPLLDRFQTLSKKIPEGMRGTDCFTWATRMAVGICKGKPLDVLFEDYNLNGEKKGKWTYTLLNEEGIVIKDGLSYVVGGSLNSAGCQVALDKYPALIYDVRARVRLSIHGPVSENQA